MAKNYLEIYFEKLATCGISRDTCDKLIEFYGNNLAKASYATKSNTGLAYAGSLIETILTKLTVFAIRLNELYPEEIRVDKNSLVKVCLLQHIAKCQRLTPSTDMWRVSKLGEVFTYTDGQPAIGTGLHSLVMASAAGVAFTPIEAEAMTIIDKKDDDIQAKYHSSLLSTIVKHANEMVYAQQTELEKLKKEPIEE